MYGRYLVYYLLACLIGDCWAEMQFSAGTLTAQMSRPIVSSI
jgi:hypothetical protein